MTAASVLDECRTLARSGTFHDGVTALIVANAVVIGLETVPAVTAQAERGTSWPLTKRRFVMWLAWPTRRVAGDEELQCRPDTAKSEPRDVRLTS